jgi:hypothetical protein
VQLSAMLGSEQSMVPSAVQKQCTSSWQMRLRPHATCAQPSCTTLNNMWLVFFLLFEWLVPTFGYWSGLVAVAPPAPEHCVDCSDLSGMCLWWGWRWAGTCRAVHAHIQQYWSHSPCNIYARYNLLLQCVVTQSSGVDSE